MKHFHKRGINSLTSHRDARLTAYGVLAVTVSNISCVIVLWLCNEATLHTVTDAQITLFGPY